MGNIGFVGVGKMGSRMANRLIEGGHSLTIWNRKDEFFEDNVRSLAAQGAKVAASPKECATGKDVCFTDVVDGPALKEVTLGTDGILGASPAPKILIDMATVGPWESEEVAAAAEVAGVGFLRSPVSGSTGQAAAGKLVIIASGDRAVYDAADEYLALLGEQRYYIGEGERARYLKLVVNMNNYAQLQILAESLAFGEKGGLDWETMLEVINSSVSASPLVKYKIPLFKNRKYDPAFNLKMVPKDLSLTLEAGRRAGVEMPVTQSVSDHVGKAIAEGWGELDAAAVVLWYEKMAGLKPEILS